MLDDGETWRVIEGRWQDSAPDEVDVVISDPPYSEHVHRNLKAECRGGDKASFDAITDWSFVRIFLRVSKRWVLCFCALEDYGKYEIAAPEHYVRSCAWLKPDGAPQFSKDRPAQWGEGIALLNAKTNGYHWNGGGHRGVYTHNVCRKDRHHETQKPLSLMIELVELFSDPGELVWDPYCGSGTTGVACLLTGRRFLGHEMQPRYAKIARDRLTATEQGLTLDDYYAGQTSLFGGNE